MTTPNDFCKYLGKHRSFAALDQHARDPLKSIFARKHGKGVYPQTALKWPLYS